MCYFALLYHIKCQENTLKLEVGDYKIVKSSRCINKFPGHCSKLHFPLCRIVFFFSAVFFHTFLFTLQQSPGHFSPALVVITLILIALWRWSTSYWIQISMRAWPLPIHRSRKQRKTNFCAFRPIVRCPSHLPNPLPWSGDRDCTGMTSLIIAMATSNPISGQESKVKKGPPDMSAETFLLCFQLKGAVPPRIQG